MANNGRPERLHVENVTGDALFVIASPQPPEIPDGSGQECPQCKKTAWLRSRWCWHCGFDFDRATLPKLHATKLLWMSALINGAAALALGWLAVAHYMTSH
jgi:hypothetical protein